MKTSSPRQIELAALLILLGACGPAPLPDATSPDWTVDEPTEPAEPTEPTEPTEPAAPTCLPQPESALLQPPPEFVGSLSDCNVQAPPGENFPATSCEERSLTLLIDSTSTTWHFADPQGSRITDIEVHNDFSFNDAFDEHIWTFDEQERLVYESHLLVRGDGTRYATELTHDYRDDRVSRIDHLSADGLTQTLFTYDEQGRLSLATRTLPDDSHESAAWTYANDRPLELTRQRNDQPLIHIRWTFSPEGRLEQMQVNADVASQAPAPLDSYAQHADWPHFMGIPSNAGSWSPAQPSDQTCTPLPTSLTHGYPAHEKVYDLLGSATALELHHVSTAYQGYGLFMRFGLDFWVGHDGAGYAWPAAVESGDRWKTTRQFNADGLMISEELHRLNALDEPLERATRERDIQNGRILTDRLQRELSPLNDDPSILPARALTFDYDTRGRLTARTLTSADDTILQRAAWIWNDNRLTQHHVDSQRDQPSPTLGAYRLDDTTAAIPTGRFTLDPTEHHYWIGAHSPPLEFTQPAP